MGLKSLYYLNKIGVSMYWNNSWQNNYLGKNNTNLSLYINNFFNFFFTNFFFNFFFTNYYMKKKIGYLYYFKKYNKSFKYNYIYSYIWYLKYQNINYIIINLYKEDNILITNKSINKFIYFNNKAYIYI